MSTYDTDPYATQSTGTGQSTGSGDMKERVADSVAEVDAGAKHVASVAGEEVKGVAHDAKNAAKGFLHETRSQLTDQASTQQRRAADALRSTSDELSGLADGTATGSGGAATSAVRAVGEQTRRVADWLEQREPADVVYEVRSFARRHTGAFLALAVGVGLIAGRVTRALVSDARDSNGTSGSTGRRPMLTEGAGTGYTGTTGGYGDSTGAYAGAAGVGAAGAGVGTDVYEGETPIGDALAGDQTGDPLSAGTESSMASGDVWTPPAGTTGDEWTTGGEERR
ncbi:hypothetical protein [Microbacterium hibisci]|uniref:hypothetical protein n=1 Tax=Microbacterium hibisci TaxID=2036000 RepID=UPI0019428BF2|nr:hypothetical protein [Microbacterium hibisci]